MCLFHYLSFTFKQINWCHCSSAGITPPYSLLFLSFFFIVFYFFPLPFCSSDFGLFLSVLPLTIVSPRFISFPLIFHRSFTSHSFLFPHFSFLPPTMSRSSPTINVTDLSVAVVGTTSRYRSDGEKCKKKLIIYGLCSQKLSTYYKIDSLLL